MQVFNYLLGPSEKCAASSIKKESSLGIQQQEWNRGKCEILDIDVDRKN